MSVVYFIRQPNGVGPVKIGCTKNLRERLACLRGSSPVALEVIAQFPGDWQDEQRLHNALLADNSHGEWFNWSSRLAEVVAAVNFGSFTAYSLPRVVGVGQCSVAHLKERGQQAPP